MHALCAVPLGRYEQCTLHVGTQVAVRWQLFAAPVARKVRAQATLGCLSTALWSVVSDQLQLQAQNYYLFMPYPHAADKYT